MKEYYGKYVVIEDIDGQIFRGKVDMYFEADENEDGKESFAVDTESGDLVEFREEEIKTIEVLDD